MKPFHKKMTRFFFLGMLILTIILVAYQPANAAKKLRKVYLTKDSHTGGTALLACEPGFHMASIWEILDVSSLRYDTIRGLTKDDSGFGPPSSVGGWIRTGFDSNSLSSILGQANCDSWKSNHFAHLGTVLHLESGVGAQPYSMIDPWVASVHSCDQATQFKVWCVSDK